MTETFSIHPTHPQLRLIQRAADIIREGGVIVYPTDSAYALGCQMGDKAALDRIRQIRQLSKEHNFTLVCRDLSEISVYAQIDNPTFRLLKAHTPGPYTFILKASKEVPRRLLHPKRKTIGLRIPDNKIALELLDALSLSMLSVTLMLPGHEFPMSDLDDIQDQLSGKVDLIIDGGFCGIDPTSVIDFTSGVPEVARAGKGDVSAFESY